MAVREAALAALPDAVVVVGDDDRVLYANAAAAALLDRAQAELAGRRLADVLRAPDGEELPPGQLHVTASEEGSGHCDVAVPRAGEGDPIGLRAAVRAVPDLPGTVVAVLRRTDLAVRSAAATFLSDASALLAASLDYDTTLETVARLVVPFLADWCAVDLEEDDGSIRRLTVAHADAAREDLADALRQLAPEPDSEHPVAHTLRTGESQLFTTVDDAELRSHARDERQLRLWRELGLTSAMVVPLTARGRTFGVMSLDATTPGRHYGPHDLALAEDLAGRAALAVDNARLHAEVSYQRALLTAQTEAGIDGVLVVSPDRRMVSYNRRFVEMWPISEEAIASGSEEAALQSAQDKVVDPEAFLAPVLALYARETEPVRDEVQLRDGRVFDRYGTRLRGEEGTDYGWAWYVRDVTEQRHAQERVREAGERFQRLARTLQESLLPPHLPRIPGMKAAARYVAASGSMDVGGDFYDLFRTGGKGWAVVMGDVCGKGAEAATVTALARYTVRAAAIQRRSPRRVLELLNAALIEQRGDERFVTAVYARIRPVDGRMSLTLSCGGHPLPLILRHDGTVEHIGRAGTLLGLFDAVELHDDATELAPGDTVVLCTDGVLDARRADGATFDDAGLRDLLAGSVTLSADAIAERIENAVREFQAGELRDDTAVLVLRVNDT